MLYNYNMSEITTTKDSDKYKLFLHWYSLSPEQKKINNLPTNIPDFLQKNNLTISDLQNFYSRESFSDDVVEATVKWAKTKTSEMVHILYDRYKERKSAQDFNAFMDFISKINTKNNTTQQINIFNINDEQYKQIISRESRVIQQGNNLISEPSS